MISRAYDPSDGEIVDELAKLTGAAKDFDDPGRGLAFHVNGVLVALLDQAADAERPATRAKHIRRARAVAKAYGQWRHEYIDALVPDDPRLDP